MREQSVDPKLDPAAQWLDLEVGATPFRPKKLVVKICTVIKTLEVWGCVRKSL
jgi:hypothetical protein